MLVSLCAEILHAGTSSVCGFFHSSVTSKFLEVQNTKACIFNLCSAGIIMSVARRMLDKGSSKELLIVSVCGLFGRLVADCSFHRSFDMAVEETVESILPKWVPPSMVRLAGCLSAIAIKPHTQKLVKPPSLLSFGDTVVFYVTVPPAFFTISGRC